MANYYDILGVSKSADEKEIRQAFRRGARKYHPDLNSGDKESEEQFKLINEAYEVLSDSEKRKKYDRYGDQWKHAEQLENQARRGAGDPFVRTYHQGGTGEYSDLFGGLDDLLGGVGGRFRRRSGAAARRRIEGAFTVSLEEAFSGTNINVSFSSGEGERRIEVAVPPGVDTGSVVRVSPDRNTELLINITVSPDSRFQRIGDDLYSEVPVPFEDAILGGEAEVTTIEGRQVWVKIPSESQNGQRIRLRGQGMPKLDSPDERGDLFVTMRPTLPKDLSEEEIDLIREFKELRTTDAE